MHLAAMWCPTAPASAPPAPPTAPTQAPVKRELPASHAGLALSPRPPKRPRPAGPAAEAAVAAPPPVRARPRTPPLSQAPPAVVKELERRASAVAVLAQAAGQPTSRYVGVSWGKNERRWRAQINHEGRNQSLGYFAEEEAAARAFDDAARRLRGNMAHGTRRQGGTWRLNFPTEAEIARADE